jgi:hypothetical protein
VSERTSNGRRAENPDIENDEDELLLTDEVEPAEMPVPGEEEVAEEEEVLTFGDETDVKDDDTGLVKHLRAEVAKARREAAEAKRGTAPPKPIEVGEKPTLLGCDYDEEKYEAELDAWKERKAASERQTATSREATEEQAQQWASKITKIAEEKIALGKADTDETFETVKAALSESQLATVIATIDEGGAAKFIYALGKHPDRLAALAAQTDTIRLIKDVTRLEGQLKMVKQRKVIEPDTPERGSARLSKVSTDKRLAKLEAEAERTGDRTELIKYKKSLRQASE